jgi:hypothetical protein
MWALLVQRWRGGELGCGRCWYNASVVASWDVGAVGTTLAWWRAGVVASSWAQVRSGLLTITEPHLGCHPAGGPNPSLARRTTPPYTDP